MFSITILRQPFMGIIKMKKALLACVGVVVITVLILYMTGFFATDKITPRPLSREIRDQFQPEGEAQALVRSNTETYAAVGPIRPRTETQLEAQVTGKGLKVRAKSGDAINTGDHRINLYRHNR